MKWEYRVVHVENAEKFGGSYKTDVITDVLNVQGKDGWEMIEVFAPIKMSNTQGNQLLFIFKRPLA